MKEPKCPICGERDGAILELSEPISCLIDPGGVVVWMPENIVDVGMEAVAFRCDVHGDWDAEYIIEETIGVKDG